MSEAQAVVTLPAAQPRRMQEIRVVNDPIPVLDTARFEHMQRIATVMAHSSLVPDALCKTKVGEGQNARMVPLEPQEIVSNCFLVVNQAVRWGMDPFAVAQCVSVVHGKLCYEGKLIAAVLDAKLGIELEYDLSGQNDAMKVIVSGAIDGKAVVDSKSKPKTVEGTVSDWKTTGNGSPWSAKGGSARMLRYRGAREWARVYAPSIMLGVYSDDEMDALSDERRGRTATEVVVREDPPAPPPAPQLVAKAVEAAVVEDAPKVAPQQEAQADAPAPTEPIVAEPPKDAAPDPDKNPEAFLKWCDDRLKQVSDPEELSDVFNAEIEPYRGGLFPPDDEVLMATYKRHENRLGID